jgi:hypothetical protein
MAEGGVSRIPISATVDTNVATENQNGVIYNVRAIYLSSETGNAVPGVNLSLSAGNLALTSVQVPATGQLTVYSYVPTTAASPVNLTITKDGFLAKTVQVQ